jgi:predicted DCC family thiol-disulfide oxidoreductase YuxK
MKTELKLKQPVLLFDGVCNLCNNSVQQIIKMDTKGKIQFASLQSEVGQSLLVKFNLPKSNFKTLVLVIGDRYLTKSDAVLEILKIIGGGWKVLYAFKIIPKFIRNSVYDFIAKNRYKWWGQQESCMMPTPELKKRFL